MTTGAGSWLLISSIHRRYKENCKGREHEHLKLIPIPMTYILCQGPTSQKFYNLPDHTTAGDQGAFHTPTTAPTGPSHDWYNLVHSGASLPVPHFCRIILTELHACKLVCWGTRSPDSQFCLCKPPLIWVTSKACGLKGKDGLRKRFNQSASHCGHQSLALETDVHPPRGLPQAIFHIMRLFCIQNEKFS